MTIDYKKVTYFVSAVSVIIILSLIGVIIYFSVKPKENVPTQVHVIPPPPVLPQERLIPEFRGPPIKSYKPSHVQQIGVLLGPNEEVLPLYGKASRIHRDRYNYYTTTGGHNLYPIPITHKNRDCMDKIGCNELYDTDQVSILGKSGNYTVNIYKNKNLF